MDSDVKQSLVNLAESEKELKSKMTAPAWEKDFSNIAQNDYGNDEDISDT